MRKLLEDSFSVIVIVVKVIKNSMIAIMMTIAAKMNLLIYELNQMSGNRMRA